MGTITPDSNASAQGMTTEKKTNQHHKAAHTTLAMRQFTVIKTESIHVSTIKTSTLSAL